MRVSSWGMEISESSWGDSHSLCAARHANRESQFPSSSPSRFTGAKWEIYHFKVVNYHFLIPPPVHLIPAWNPSREMSNTGGLGSRSSRSRSPQPAASNIFSWHLAEVVGPAQAERLPCTLRALRARVAANLSGQGPSQGCSTRWWPSPGLGPRRRAPVRVGRAPEQMNHVLGGCFADASQPRGCGGAELGSKKSGWGRLLAWGGRWARRTALHRS